MYITGIDSTRAGLVSFKVGRPNIKEQYHRRVYMYARNLKTIKCDYLFEQGL